MSGSGKKRSVLELGHDAFLDIVANLVGILIILVVVLGTQSTALIEQIKEQATPETEQAAMASETQLAELAQQSMRAAAAQADSLRLENMVKRYDATIEGRQQQRNGLLDLLSAAQEAWQEKRQEIDAEAAALARRKAAFSEATETLAQLQGERERLENLPEEVVAVAHLPTPMAKTVFGDELHFRLKGNRLSIVPIEKLLEEIRRDFGRVASGSGGGRMNSAVGPIRGYVASYEMDKNRELYSQGGQLGMATRVQLVGMKIEPLKEPHGQPLETMLRQGSELEIELAGRDPGSTTITVWVYPDSFAAFRAFKEHLYRKGFATAARPLTMDRAIIGSPHGSRSRAQ